MFKWLKNQIMGTDEDSELAEELETAVEQAEEISESPTDLEGDTLLDSEVEEETVAEEVVEAEEQCPIVDEEEEIAEVFAEVLEEKLEAEEEIESEAFEEPVEEEEELVEEVEVEVSTEPEVEVLEEEKYEPEAVEPIEETVEVVEEVAEEKTGFFGKLFSGLTKTRKEFTEKITMVLGGYVNIDEELYEDLEDILISADVGMETTMLLIDRVRDNIYANKVKDPNEVRGILSHEIKSLIKESIDDFSLNVEKSPSVLLVVGVNGVGKTTTIGKLSNRFKGEGKKVLIAAADTFRAAAIEQLEEWANRANVEIVSHQEGADPAAVVFDGIQAAKSRGSDILICDTAGRLHNKSNLMNELNKIFRIIDTNYPEAEKEVLLVLDATTGQNAMNQAKTFKEVANITGVALTKLDGTAKGGIVIALQSELKLPVKLIGVGEGINDLQNFDVDSFVDALFE